MKNRLDEEVTLGTFLRWAVGAAVGAAVVVWLILKAVTR